MFHGSPCSPGMSVQQDGYAQGEFQGAGEETPFEESLLGPWLLGDQKDIRGDVIFLNGARIWLAALVTLDPSFCPRDFLIFVVT